jgi:glutamine synthetase
MSKIASSPKEVIKYIKSKEITFVNLKFTDSFGVWQNLMVPSHQIEEDTFKDGIPFDGSSVRGWKSINESDMLLMPDPTTLFIDPFFTEPVLSVSCDIADPETKKAYDLDPRTIAKKAVEYLKSSGIGDTAYFGPEAEFFIFDSVRYSVGANHSYYEVDSVEACWNTDRDEEEMGGNLGYKTPHKRGYFPVAPMDKTGDIRLDMIKTLEEVGITVEKGHHEVATAGQGEINFLYSDLIETADNLMKYKYVLRNIAGLHGKYLTFLPKPLTGDNGSGMHSHFSIWKKGENQFSGKEYAGLSKTALYAIGGIIKHGRTLALFTNPTVNSYHRLVPGFEAPVILTYSYRNRSAAIRVPYVPSPKAKRIECRFPDASSNPYLAFTVLLLAAIDGIKNKIEPVGPLDKDLYEMEEKKLSKIPHMPSTLLEAIEAAKADHKFLTDTGVVTKEFLDMWIEAKQAEYDAVRLSVNPKEFELYGDI